MKNERGYVSMWFVVATIVAVMLLGLVVDGGGAIREKERVRDVAAQAARAGGQQLQAAAAIQGDGANVDPHLAARAAQEYLARAGFTGEAHTSGDNRITVTARGTYRTQFLSIVGIGTLPADGTATARLARVIGGAER